MTYIRHNWFFICQKCKKKWKSNLKLTDHHFFNFFYKFQFIPIKLSLLWFLNQHNPTEALQKLRFGCWTHMKPIFTHTWHRKYIFYGEMYPFYPIFWHISPFFSILGWTKHRKTLYFLKGMGVTTLFSLWGHHNLFEWKWKCYDLILSLHREIHEQKTMFLNALNHCIRAHILLTIVL